jgi:hypothetical protein
MAGSGAESPNANLAEYPAPAPLSRRFVPAAGSCVVKLSLADGPPKNYCPRHASNADSSAVRFVVLVDPDGTVAHNVCSDIIFISIGYLYLVLLCTGCNAGGTEVAVSWPRTTLHELPLIMTKTWFFYFVALPRMSRMTGEKSMVSSNLNGSDRDRESNPKQYGSVLPAFACKARVTPPW